MLHVQDNFSLCGCCRPPTWRGTSGAAGYRILEVSRAPDGSRLAGGKEGSSNISKTVSKLRFSLYLNELFYPFFLVFFADETANNL